MRDPGAKGFEDTLNDLGIDTRSIASEPVTDVGGNALPESYNPLSGVQVPLYRTPERPSTGGWFRFLLSRKAGIPRIR